MALIPHKITALAESDSVGTDGKNIIAGAVVSLFDEDDNAITLYDDDSGSNGSTTKTTDATGQVVVYVTPGEYSERVNGGTKRKVSIFGNSTANYSAFSDLEDARPTQTGQSFICQERSNAEYILQASGYTALAGDVTFSNGRVAALQNTGNPRYFGASESKTDNSSELLSFFNRIFSDSVNSSHYSVSGECGEFEVTSGIELILNTNHTGILDINLKGIKIVAGSGYANTKPLFSIKSEAVNRHIYIKGGYFEGNSRVDTTFLLDGGDKTDTQFLYNCVLQDNVIRGGILDSLKVTGNVFETAFIDNHGQMANTTGKVFNFVNRSPNALSSIDVRGGSTRGGLNGLYSDCNDIKIYGGTYIESGGYAVDCRSGAGNLLSGIHVENAWQDGSGSNNAGINLTGSGLLEHCLATSVNGIHDTLYDVFSSGAGVTVVSGYVLGGCDKTLRVKSGSSKVMTSGLLRSECVFPSTSEERLTSFSEKGLYQNSLTVSGSVTPNMDTYDTFVYNLTGNTTINATLNPVSGDVLKFIFKQDATGGRTVTLNAAYKGSPTINTSANARTCLTYIFGGGTWDLLSEVSY